MLVSIIIPTLNEEAYILDAIRSARQNYASDEIEIIVVDGGSQDDTLSLIPPRIQVFHSLANRGAQMNLGAANSHGEILVFCHADSLLPEGWREEVIDTLSNNNISGGTFQLSIVPAKGILRLRNRVTYPANWMVMYGDQVHFMSRSTFEKIGGYPEIPIMEDLEMSRSLNKAGQLVRIPLRVKTSSRGFSASSPIKQWLLNIKCVLLYVYFGKTADDIKTIYDRGGSQES
jgi:rSAM/selenodomain-associated transferase 2